MVWLARYLGERGTGVRIFTIIQCRVTVNVPTMIQSGVRRVPTMIQSGVPTIIQSGVPPMIRNGVPTMIRCDPLDPTYLDSKKKSRPQLQKGAPTLIDKPWKRLDPGSYCNLG